MGRLRAVAAGARRTKSRYGAALEPLSHVRAFIFEREHRDLLRMNSAELIESFFDMQKDYRVQLAAQYLAEVGERMIPEREPNDRLFRLFLAVLRSLNRSGEVTRPLLYFDYWLLRLAGFLPDFNHCQSCGRALGEADGFYLPGGVGLVWRANESPWRLPCGPGVRSPSRVGSTAKKPRQVAAKHAVFSRTSSKLIPSGNS